MVMEKEKRGEQYDDYVQLSILRKQVDFIKEIVAGYYNQPMSDYDLKTRKAEIVKIKYVAIFVCLSKLRIKLRILADIFKCDHATILHGKKTIKNYISWDRDLLKEVNEIFNLVEHKLMIIEGKIDLVKDYTFVDLNHCIGVRVSQDKFLVFTGYTTEEVKELLGRLNINDKTPTVFDNTKTFLLKKNNKNNDEKV